MTGRPLTIADLLAVSGYTRDQMRGLLDAIPSYAARDTKVRVAKQYTAHDLLVVRACAQLESRYQLQRAAVVAFVESLKAMLAGPRPVSTTAHLLLTFDPLDVSYVESPIDLQEGLLVPLAPIFQAVDGYLLPGAQATWSQRELGFAPRAVNTPMPATPTPTKVVKPARRKM